MKEAELRIKALELAHNGEPAESVVKRAALYLTFLSGSTVVAASAQPSPPPPQPSTDTKAAAASDQNSAGDTASPAPATTDSTAGNSGPAGSQADAPAADNGAAQDTAAFDGDVGKLQAKCMALSGRDGAAKLLEQFQALGAGKWSEVKPEQYPQLWANLTAAGV